MQIKAPTHRRALFRQSEQIPTCQATRVGFEPYLSGLKDQRPHQKSNESKCFVFLCAPRAQLPSCILFALFRSSHEKTRCHFRLHRAFTIQRVKTQCHIRSRHSGSAAVHSSTQLTLVSQDRTTRGVRIDIGLSRFMASIPILIFVLAID